MFRNLYYPDDENYGEDVANGEGEAVSPEPLPEPKTRKELYLCALAHGPLPKHIDWETWGPKTPMELGVSAFAEVFNVPEIETRVAKNIEREIIPSEDCSFAENGKYFIDMTPATRLDPPCYMNNTFFGEVLNDSGTSISAIFVNGKELKVYENGETVPSGEIGIEKYEDHGVDVLNIKWMAEEVGNTHINIPADVFGMELVLKEEYIPKTRMEKYWLGRIMDINDYPEPITNMEFYIDVYTGEAPMADVTQADLDAHFPKTAEEYYWCMAALARMEYDELIEYVNSKMPEIPVAKTASEKYLKALYESFYPTPIDDPLLPVNPSIDNPSDHQ